MRLRFILPLFFQFCFHYQIVMPITSTSTTTCYHCGEPCLDSQPIQREEKSFCCVGCVTVYDLLASHDLCGYYDVGQNEGVSLKAKNLGGQFDFLKNEDIAQSLLSFSSPTQASITLYIPAIHCSSCVWLLENLSKIQTGVQFTRLNFPEKKIFIQFDPRVTDLLTIVSLLTTLGYEPVLQNQSDAHEKGRKKQERRLLTQIAVTGFCLGNSMLLSFPEYFEFDPSSQTFQNFFLYLNFGLGLPVYFFGAWDYLKGGWQGITALLKRQTKTVSVDIPIAMGISALFLRSMYETWLLGSAGYWDSLAGLVFFLLVGKWVQQRTYAYLTFKRDHASYFPLAVERKESGQWTYKPIHSLQPKDRIRIRPNGLIPADSIVVQDTAWIDYSFVSGESVPVSKRLGEKVFAGGRQLSSTVELEVLKSVDQSYLTQLWNQDAFTKEKEPKSTALANAFSQYFTLITVAIALFAALYWWQVNPALVWPTATAVLMVACPCALTLALPFAMNTALGILGQNKFYVKNQHVLNQLTEIDQLILDKTGTLTSSKHGHVQFIGKKLTDHQLGMIRGLAEQSAHPLSKTVAHYLKNLSIPAQPSPESSKETPGLGIEGWTQDTHIQLGQARWIESTVDLPNQPDGSWVWVGWDGALLGYFHIQPVYRTGWKKVLSQLTQKFQLTLLSGDHPRDLTPLYPFFTSTNAYFEQSPMEKMAFVQNLQAQGHKVCMIGDGLNDAGALQQSEVGIALSEEVQVFTPAADGLLDASEWSRLPDFIGFASDTLHVVKLAFLLSLVFNGIGLSWAVSGQLSPVLAAIFMPLSSLTVVLVAVGLTFFKAWRKKLIFRI